ncbi:ATP-binding protein [Longispora sp. NPDC051575]|uniref:ATP-binding protein n=1 Tax=Longispora sp. NPDC051575 TaxID=3154943 RepID=UPI003420FE6D
MTGVADDQTPATDEAVSSSDGERVAVEGFGGQYLIAAQRVLMLAQDLVEVRVADPEAGAVDDFAACTEDAVHALQVKSPTFPGTITLNDLCAVGKNGRSHVGDLADGWTRLVAREAESGLRREVTVWFITEDNAANKERKFPTCTLGSHTSAFVQNALYPVQSRLRAGEVPPAELVEGWRAAFDKLHDASGLDEGAFWDFLRCVRFEFGAKADPAWLGGSVQQVGRLRSEAVALAKYFFGRVAMLEDDVRVVEIAAEELWKAMVWDSRPGFHHPHVFPVPAAYVVNDDVEIAVHDLVDSTERGYVLLEGAPGSGKSTLLAATELPTARVVRYYAFVPDTPSVNVRGEAAGFVDDVCSALRKAGVRTTVGGSTAADLRTRLAEAMDACAADYRSGGMKTVIVVDGLDHIPREQNPVMSLLSVLPAPDQVPDGVVFLLGSQTAQFLSGAIRAHLSTARRVRMSPLADVQVLDIADRAGVGQALHPGQRERLVDAVGGHPLALTYLLRSLEAALAGDDAGRDGRVEGVLAKAAEYGSDVEARYRGYWQQVCDHADLLRLVAVAAWLRRPVDVRWLSAGWGQSLVGRFVAAAGALFHVQGDEWHFFHNSFRLFLRNNTTGPDGADEETVVHAEIADRCRDLADRWPDQAFDELAHRILAGQHAQALQVAQPEFFMAQLDALRPHDDVCADIRLAVRLAAERGDLAALIRLNLALSQAGQREMALSSEDVATALAEFGSATQALPHLLSGRSLRVAETAGLKAARLMARAGSRPQASRLFLAAGPMRAAVTDGGRDLTRGGVEHLRAWVQAATYTMTPTALVARIDRDLPAAPVDVSVATDEGAQEQRELRAAYRAHALKAAVSEWHASGDTDAAAVGLELLWAEHTVAAAATTIGVVTILCDDGKIGRARPLMDDLVTRVEAGVPGGELPAAMSTRIAGLLVRVDGTTERAQRFLPAQESFEGERRPGGRETPWESSYEVHRLRHVLGVGRPAEDVVEPPKNARGAGVVRFGRALLTIAELDAAATRHEWLGGPAPSAVLVTARTLLRVFEAPTKLTFEWTEWHAVTDFGEEYFYHLARVVARTEPETLKALCAYAVERFAAVQGWHPRRRRQLITGFLRAGASLSWGIAQLDLLQDHLAQPGVTDPEDRASQLIALAAGYRHAGAEDAAHDVVRLAVGSATGIGSHEDDEQMLVWARWLHAAVRAEPDRDTNAARIVDFLRRLVPFGGDQYAWQLHKAAAEALRAAWTVQPGWALQLGRAAMRHGLLGVPDLIAVLITCAADDPTLTPLAVDCTAELLIPVHGHPADGLWDLLMRHSSRPAEDLRTLADATGAHSNRGQRSQHATEARHAVDAADKVTQARAEDYDDLFGLDPTGDHPTTGSDYDPLARGELLVAGQRWTAAQVAAAAATAAELLGILQDAEPVTTRDYFEAFPWRAILPRVLPTATNAQLRAIATALLDHDLTGAEQLLLARTLADRGDEATARRVLRHAVARPVDGIETGGWSAYRGETTRQEIWAILLQLGDPQAQTDALTDLADTIGQEKIHPPRVAPDLEAWIDMLGRPDTRATTWPDVDKYLTRVAEADTTATFPPLDPAAQKDGEAVAAVIDMVVGFLGHPARCLDYGARRVLLALIDHPSDESQAQIVADRLAGALRDGGWPAEAAAAVLAAGANPPGGHPLCPHLPAGASQALHDAIDAAIAGDDLIIADLATLAADHHGLPPARPTPQDLPAGYSITVPPVPAGHLHSPDPETGAVALGGDNPRFLIAPYDTTIDTLADAIDMPSANLLHRAAAIARGDTSLGPAPWRHHSGADAPDVAELLQRDGLKVSHRPTSLLRGRRAISRIMSELDRAGLLPAPRPRARQFTPADWAGLIAPELARAPVGPVYRHTRLPTVMDRSFEPGNGWLDQLEEALTASTADLSGDHDPVLIAETSRWRRNTSEKCDELRMRTIASAPPDLPHGPLSQAPPSRRMGFDTTYKLPDYLAAATSPRPGDPAPQRWVCQDELLPTESGRWEWLGLHPGLCRTLGWTLDPTRPLAWRGPDGALRSWTIWFENCDDWSPSAGTDFAHGCQLLITRHGSAELERAFGSLELQALVERTTEASADAKTCSTVIRLDAPGESQTHLNLAD